MNTPQRRRWDAENRRRLPHPAPQSEESQRARVAKQERRSRAWGSMATAQPGGASASVVDTPTPETPPAEAPSAATSSKKPGGKGKPKPASPKKPRKPKASDE